MTEEVQIQAEVPAPELETTAVPESEVIQPEEKPAEVVKTFTQKNLTRPLVKGLLVSNANGNVNRPNA